LETGLAGSINTEVIEFVGAENVAPRTLGAGNLAQVAVEQVLSWDPDWIIAADPAFAQAARTDPVWQALRAVRAGRVVAAPSLPYGWIDAPPSVNRLLGLAWLPVLFGVQPAEALPARLADLYATLFHRRPDPAQIAALLRDALPAKG
jgi:iron complex transport system substrate-binding protein